MILHIKNVIRICFVLALFMICPSVYSADNTSFKGAVYAMSNNFDRNTIVAYGRDGDGRLSYIGEFYTGGKGGAYDGGEGLDPLISAYALLLTDDRRHLIAVNAGSDSFSVFRVNPDFSLRLTDQKRVYGVGPNSIAYDRGLIYVSSIDADGKFTGEPDQEGVLTGYRLTKSGKLKFVRKSGRLLGNRPSAIQFSPDGKHLVVTSINAGSAALASGSTDELVVYRVHWSGRLSRKPVSRTALNPAEQCRREKSTERHWLRNCSGWIRSIRSCHRGEGVSTRRYTAGLCGVTNWIGFELATGRIRIIDTY